MVAYTGEERGEPFVWPRLCMRAAEPLLLGAASLEAPKSPLRRVQRSLEAPLSEPDPLLHWAHLATLCA